MEQEEEEEEEVVLGVALLVVWAVYSRVECQNYAQRTERATVRNTHTHTHTHTHTQAETHTRTHACAHPLGASNTEMSLVLMAPRQPAPLKVWGSCDGSWAPGGQT